MTFALHFRLGADTLPVADLALCRVLLMNDSRFPWLILVPRRQDLRELFDLTTSERATLIEEVTTAARVLQMVTGAAKMNVGAIGNLVPQLHLHVVARFESDGAWPAPVWGYERAVPYVPDEAKDLIATFSGALNPLVMTNSDP